MKMGILRDLTIVLRRFGGTTVPPNGIVPGDMRAGDGAMIPKGNPMTRRKPRFPAKIRLQSFALVLKSHRIDSTLSMMPPAHAGL